MISKRILATVLVLLAVTVTLAEGVVPVGYQVSGDQLTVTLSNSGSTDVTVNLTAFQFGATLGTVTVTVPAESISAAVFTVTDEMNPFGFAVAVAN